MLLLMLASVPVSASAQPHEGLFFRVAGGPRYGFGIASGRKQGGFQTHGYAAGFDVEIGYTHFENLAIHGDITYQRLVGRKSSHELLGELELDEMTENLDYTLFSLGIGATYYLMPHNVYFTVGAGFGRLSVTDDGQASRRKEVAIGLTINTMVGREWYFADDLSFGVGGQITWSTTSDRSALWNLLSIGLVVTATYN